MPFTTNGSNLIVNGSFEDVTGLTAQSFGFTGAGSIVGWLDANGSSIDIHQDNRSGILPTDGISWLDLQGSPDIADVSQAVSGVTEGGVYQMSFDLGQASDIENDDNGVEVYWNGDLIVTVDAASGTLETLNFTVIGGSGDGSNTLRFVGTDSDAADNIGASLDSVELALVLDLADDSVSLTEEEGGGDVDLNALSNDTGSALEVTSVAGSAANIGVAVAGDNGGTFTISANGDVDFDAAGQFEDLGANESAVTSVTYSVSQPDPFDPGAQSVQTSGAVGPSDQTAFFTLNAGEFSNDGTTGISGSVTLSDITQPKFNIVFVMDVSGSTGFSSPTFPGVGDLNNDGDANEVIDAEIAAFRQLSDDIAALGFPASNVDIGFITFESAGDQVLRTNEDDGSNVFKAGSTKLFNELGEVAAGGGTDFESALQETISFLTAQGATASDNNVVYFLSDGIPNNNNVFTDEVATLVNSFNAQINGIGISSGSSLSDLNLLDTTGGAQQVTSIPQLNAALQNPFSDADVVDFRIFVDGVEDASIDVTDLSATPLGFDINAQAISGITQAANAASVIVAEIEFDDGTVLRNTVSVQTPIADTATVTVTVTGVNDAPVAGDDDAVVNEDTPVTIDVLGNDVDVDGDPLVVSSVSDPANGTAVVNPDGTVTYTPDADFTGTDTITYTVSDGQGGTDTATVTVTVDPVNDAPVAGDDDAVVNEDTPVTIDVLGNDVDVDGDPLVVSSVSDPANGTAVVNPDGTVTYTPDADFTGTDTITYTVSDGQGGTDTATVTVTVDPVNDAPVAGDDDAVVNEDTPVTIDVLGNDVDVDGDPLVVSSVSDPANGTAVVNPDGTVTYTPDADFTGTDTITYTVSDGQGGTDTATVTVTVDPVNDAPVAGDDDAVVNEDTPVTIDVLGNDVDVDGDPLVVSSVSDPANGTAVVNPDGTVTYTPDADFTGTDTITYTVSDGQGGTDTATVTVTVDPVNDAPVAGDDDAVVNEDTPVTIDVLGNDVDVDGDPLVVSSVSDPANGTAVVNPDGTVTYTPDADFTGTDTITYTVSDGQGGTDTATVTVTVDPVNDAPVAGDDDAVVNEDTPVTIDVLGNDVDVDGDPLVVSSVSDPANGTAVVNPDGTVTYTPDADFTGTDTITYTVSDGQGGTDTATVTVTVDPVNDAPVAGDDDAVVNEDTPVTIDVLGNDVDVDGDPLVVSSVSDPANGTAVVNPDGTVTYTPDADFTGTDTITYTVSDGQGGTDTATVTVTVDPVNDAPVAGDDDAVVNEDTPVTIDVLGNDVDVDGDPLVVSSVSDPANGTAVVNPDGTVTYTPDADFTGTDTITYTVSDGQGGTDTATVTVTVDPVNDAPVAGDDDAVVNEDTPVTIDVLGNDVDVDGDPLVVSSVSDPANGTAVVNPDGTVTYTPDADFTGTDTITYTVSDGQGGTDTATVTVTVDPVNDAPVAGDDDAVVNEDTPVTIDVLGNDVDVDGDPLVVSSVSDPANGTAVVNPDGTVTYTPDADFTGTDTITYTVSDGQGGTDTATVTVTVDPVNDAPVAGDDDAVVNEDTPVTIDVLGNDVDVDGDPLVVSSVSDPANGTAVVNPDGTVTYTPDADFTGTDTITYTVSDGQGGTDTATVTVTVDPVNDAPVAGDDDAVVNEDTPVTIDVLGNDVDVDGDPLVVSSVSDPANGTAVVNPDGTVTYTPDADFTGTDTITYTVSDGQGGTDTATVTVTVDPVNDAPVAGDDDAVVNEDTPVTIDVLGNDVDVDGDPLVVSSVSDPANGTAVVNPDGTVTYTPDADFTGTDTITYTVSDGQGGTDTATVTVTVDPVNDAPVAGDDDAVVNEDTPVTIDVLGNDVDVDGDPLVVSSVSDPANGTAVVNPDGTVTYTPDADFTGTDTITYTVSDGQGGTDTATVTVTVDPVNDAPVAGDDDAVVNEDTPVTIDVLGNDVDVDGDPLVVSSVSDPANGTAVVNPDGTVTYTPDADFTGTDTITYTVSDGQGGTDTATVTVTVDPVNDAPVAGDDDAVVNEDTPVTIDVLGNDVDVDGDPLVVSSVSDPANGTAVVNPDGTVTYTPDADFTGTDTITYTVSDGQGGTDTATVTVTVDPVNDAPVAGDDDAVVNEDTPVTIDVLGNDVDVDGDPLVVSSVSDPANGTAVVNPDGTVTYTPDADFTGTDTITYTVSDGQGGTDTATVTVTVDPVNDAPVAGDDDAVVNEDTPVTIDVLGNDVDVDGDPLVVSSVSDPANGTAVVNPDGTVTYTPDADFTGTDTITYTVSDGQGGTDTATVTVTVDPVNDAPVAGDDDAVVNEDTPVTIDVLGNDVDVDGDPLVVSSVSDPANGTAVVNPDGTVTYTPDADFTGTDTITYTVSDGQGGTDTATVTVTVDPVNDAPVAGDDDAVVNEDTPVTIDVLGNDVDVDGDPLVVSSVSDPANGTAVVNPDGTVTYTPDADFTGTDTITYTVSDGQGGTDTATVTVTVDPVNDAPVAGDDDAVVNEDTPVTIDVLGNDVDVDGDPLVVSSVSDPANGTAVVNPDGTVTYTPDADFTGTDTITYTVSDGQGGTDTATVTVTVDPVNDAPVAGDDDAVVNEDTPVTIDVLGNDVDVDGDPLVVSSVSDPANGTAVVNPDGTVTYTPDADFTGTDTITYTVSDGQGGTDTATVTVTVDPVNDAPVAGDDTADVDADAATTISVLDNDVDVDGDLLTIVSVTDPADGTVTLNPDGTISYDPDSAFDGLGFGETDTVTFDYTVSDGQGGTDTATVTVTVTGVNDDPVAVDDGATVTPGAAVTIDVLGNDSDPNLDTLSVLEFTQPTNGEVFQNPDGTLRYLADPALDDLTDTFSYTVTDGRGGTDTATVTVTVPDNFPPFIPEPVVFFVPEGQTFVSNVPAIDLEFDPVTFALAGSGVDDSLFSIDTNTGALTFNAPPDFSNPDDANGDNIYQIDITVSDTFGSNTQSLQVNVLDIPDANNDPIITAPGPDNDPQPVQATQLLFTFSQGVVADVEAIDPDAGDSLIFTLFGEDAPLFDFNRITGEISLNQPLTDPRGSFDGDSAYEVDVLVEDQNGGSDVLAIDFILITGA